MTGVQHTHTHRHTQLDERAYKTEIFNAHQKWSGWLEGIVVDEGRWRVSLGLTLWKKSKN